MNEPNGANGSSTKKRFTGLIWWAYLITAVLAIPSLSFLITSAIPVSGAVELLIFVIACWMCTYVGMRLMSNPKMRPPSE